MDIAADHIASAAMPPDFAAAFRPALDRLRTDVGGLEFFDVHTHIGRNDPDGFRQSPEQLLAQLDMLDGRAAVFPMHEPGGDYAAANDEVLSAAAASDGRVVAFCRVDPNEGDAAVAEARRALDAGARGIKLHPRAERFTLSHPAVEPLVALAAERRLPVLVHAGRGIPALGIDTLHLGERHRDARLILAHAAISDLAWLWRELPAHPNVFVDTSWWNPVDIVALFALAPPGQVLWASDSPYGHPLVSAGDHMRCAIQAGLTPDQMRGVAGAQAARLVAGEEPLDLGPPPAVVDPLDPALERVVSHLCASIGQVFAGADNSETLALARLAGAVGDGDPVAPLATAVLELLDRFEAEWAPPGPDEAFPAAVRFLVSALFVARTPAAGVP
jgi:uncharacterized protein